jgi:hypothetical protein
MPAISKPTAKLTPTQLRVGLAAFGAMLLSWIYLIFCIFTGHGTAVAFGIAVVTSVTYLWIGFANKKTLQSQGGDSASSRLHSLIFIEHVTGLEGYNIRLAKSAMLVPEGIIFTITKGKAILLPWGRISHVEVGSEWAGQRVTFTRMALVGIFALVLKKDRKQKIRLTIRTIDGVGLWAIKSTGRNNRRVQAKAIRFAASCNSRAQATRTDVLWTPTAKVSTGSDPLEQIERLAGLLSQGHITNDEYKSKKQSLLDRL